VDVDGYDRCSALALAEPPNNGKKFKSDRLGTFNRLAIHVATTYLISFIIILL
jgi:hypothetical protein